MNNNPVNLHSDADILAYVPHMLGETPKESFVLITMQGNALGATLRVDAPFGAEPRAYAQSAVSYATLDEAATGSLLVIYTDENTPEQPRPYAAHVQALRTELRIARMPLKDAWLVTSKAWSNYLCIDPACCPERALEEIADSTGNAALIYRGSNVKGFTTPAPFTGQEQARETIAAHKPYGWPEDTEARRSQWDGLLRNPDTLTPVAALELAGALQHPGTRDHLMVDIITNAPEQFTSVLLGVFVTRPDWTRVDTAQELAFELMKATPEGQRAPMLCMIGWLEWLKGKSSFAARYFKLALDDVEGYRLAELLTELVERGLLADCVRDPQKAYNLHLGR
ncbi:DUF4192 domain-containing protein [Paenarthrobacter aromaticivorans]|uniref:DUF4192 domain-containing protein n=1 Tax=Paenarthrobacter aromaticivorans TaxID=2849150 RepID=A0ABS6ICR0_9MICC|nr:DUF4192 domain-containing protein [Paenarthrobacter sp. MMS21-TAE1-1]MBU8869215.1 DUF4192 domain-containing protein [Paenarthrobacter sp. MMS21-TAE1-1]